MQQQSAPNENNTAQEMPITLIKRQNHLSITEFDSVEIPDFCVITGPNGSGKSHLLQAIRDKKIIIKDNQDGRVVLFSYDTFTMDNESNYSAEKVSAERQQAWNLFISPAAQRKFRRSDFSRIKSEISRSASEILQASRENRKAIWDLNANHFTNETTYADLCRYRNTIDNLSSSIQPNNEGRTAHAIISMAKRSMIFIDEIDEEYFKSEFFPYSLKEDFLPSELGRLFINYFSLHENNSYLDFRNQKYGENNTVLTDSEFLARYGPKPWEMINSILDDIESVPYRVNFPEKIDRHSHFQVKLISTIDSKIQPSFTDLSSGERTLMALVASVYKASSDRYFPDILLLDEIDASLHPSMAQSLLNVIKDIFLNNGVRVILVTHSPTTVALCPDDSVFIMNKSGSARLEKVDRAKALDVLTEGFATLERGIRILDEIGRSDLSIITEGRNANILRRSLELYDIKHVDVVGGLENCSGSKQLRTMYDLFSRVEHRMPVVIVWDCDATEYNNLDETGNTYPFVFEQNENCSFAKKGIENLFPDHLFSGFTQKLVRADGSERVEFDGSQKKAFEASVIANASKSDFAKFQPLIDYVKRVAGKH